MSLTVEWRRRIEQWKSLLERLLYQPLGKVPLKTFFTKAQLHASVATNRRFKPMAPGTAWGAKWEYAWFKGKIRLPAAARGERIVLRGDVGGESAVYINGLNAGAIDRRHKEVLLATRGKPGTTYELLIEAYAGHGRRVCGGGPALRGEETVPEPPAKQCRLGTTTYGVWAEELFQLFMDVETLFQVRENIDPESLRVQEIDAGLREVTLITDLEQPYEAIRSSARKARARLKPLLACTNGSTSPRMACFGHSHIDVAWLWPLRETEAKCTRTFATQLALMKEYPEFRFLQSQPHLYQMMKERYPDLYQRIRRAVRQRQIMPEGGMWVEADTNVTSGESLIRQFLHGKRFFKEEFGVDSEFMWLPDVFGYSGALPQIMAGCGINYFSTHKIFWNYKGGEHFPHNTFWWEGIDGSRVLSHFHTNYNAHTSPRQLISRWRDRVQKDGIVSRLYPFGFGDGGGGPTREHLEFLRRQENLEGAPRAEITHPVDFFKEEEKRNVHLPVYVGELYLQAHRGTYTSQAKTKRGNRKSEFALREAEMWGALSCALSGFAYPVSLMDGLWKRVLLNQFHDILPGSSIARVHEEAEADYAQVISGARKIAAQAGQSFVKKGSSSLTVFNSLSWNRQALVPLPKGFNGAEDSTGNPLPVQKIGATPHAVLSNIPSCGWTTIRKAKPTPVPGKVKATRTSLENEFLRLTISPSGELTSVIDRQTNQELAAEPCNSFRLYKDVPTSFDAWDLDSVYRLDPVTLDRKATVKVLSSGPVVGIVQVKRKINASTLTQEIRLVTGSRRVEFHTTVDWRESHKLLKVNFPVTVHSNDAIHEIQFGHLRRPTHASRTFDADRYEVCQQKWTALAEEGRGVALLNDCKYGVDVDHNSINLTLLKSALAPDMRADKGLQEFSYALYAWNGSLQKSRVVQESYELNIPAVTLSGAGGEASLFAVDNPNVIIEAVKPAEDGSGDVVVRLYEAMRTTTECVLTTGLPVRSVHTTDMLETREKRLAVRNGRVRLSLRPFEIKTLRFVV